MIIIYILLKSRLYSAFFCAKRKGAFKAPVGIKNSWKYEKDLMIIFNRISVSFTITHTGNKRNPLYLY